MSQRLRLERLLEKSTFPKSMNEGYFVPDLSGRLGRLLSPSPLRTVRATFTAHGSSKPDPIRLSLYLSRLNLSCLRLPYGNQTFRTTFKTFQLIVRVAGSPVLKLASLSGRANFEPLSVKLYPEGLSFCFHGFLLVNPLVLSVNSDKGAT